MEALRPTPLRRAFRLVPQTLTLATEIFLTARLLTQHDLRFHAKPFINEGSRLHRPRRWLSVVLIGCLAFARQRPAVGGIVWYPAPAGTDNLATFAADTFAHGR